MTDTTVTHPLLIGTRHAIQSWEEWKHCWHSAPNLETRQALLFAGFDVPHSNDREYTGPERICFYLDVADGHARYSNFGSGRIHDDYPESSFGRDAGQIEALKILSKRAFRMLALRFFKDREGGSTPGRFERTEWLANEQVVEKVLWFFRAEKAWRLKNLDWSLNRDNDNELAASFIENLCLFAFEDHTHKYRREDGSLAAVSKLMIPRRPQVIPILCAIGKVTALTHKDISPCVDAACMQALLITLKSDDRYFPEKHPDKTLEMACVDGSRAAQTYLMLQIIAKQREVDRKRILLLRRREVLDEKLGELK